MHDTKNQFELSFLDHVAVRVRDLRRSADWYASVLGLTQYNPPKWGGVPIFMLSGKSGVALFPATLDDDSCSPHSKNVKIDHFAFHVDPENFEKAKKRFAGMNLDFVLQDHHYFHSLYLNDPDGHTVELTTLVVDEKDFYTIKNS